MGLNGYTDSEDYYANSTPLSTLHQVTVRTLIMHAEDDPVVSFSTLPLDAIRTNPNLLAAVTRRGGHLAWASSAKVDGASWVDRVAGSFFKSQSRWGNTPPLPASKL